MSKSNGNGRLPTPDELREIVNEGQELMKLLPLDWSAKKTGEDFSRYPRYEVKSAEPWRNMHHKKMFNDICQVKGGMSRRSEAIAEWIAWARNTLPILFTVIARLQKVTPDEKYQPEIGRYKPTAASDRLVGFLELVAEAFEVLGFKENNLGYHPGDRLIGSDRKEKAELLRRLADTIDPVSDSARLRKLHHQERVPANGLPTTEDFRNLWPKTLRDAHDDYIEDDEDLERAQLDATAQRKWNIPPGHAMTMIAFRHALTEAFSYVSDQHRNEPYTESGIQLFEEINERTRAMMPEVTDAACKLIDEPTWWAENRESIEALYEKALAKETTGDLYCDLTTIDHKASDYKPEFLPPHRTI